MANIILQHWAGEMDELGNLSSANIAAYAARIGADYRLLRGNVFRQHLTAQCQKLYMLDAVFDDYDMVVMLDMDMFAVTGLTENVFTDVAGTGLFSEFTEKIFRRCQETHPELTSPKYAYWGGAIYRLTLGLRRLLRAQIVDAELDQFDRTFKDEGIMHRLAMLARVPQDRIPDRWCQCSYLPNPGAAAMIHIRCKTSAFDLDGVRIQTDKMHNYLELYNAGVIK
jgi:hypothetical protein